MQTGLGFLNLLTVQLDRTQQASERMVEPVAVTTSDGNTVGPGAATNGSKGYKAFRHTLDHRRTKSQPYTADARHMVQFLEQELGAFADEGYWEDKQMLRASLKSGMNLLRLFAAQVAQAVAAGQQGLNERDEGASVKSL